MTCGFDHLNTSPETGMPCGPNSWSYDLLVEERPGRSMTSGFYLGSSFVAWTRPSGSDGRSDPRVRSGPRPLGLRSAWSKAPKAMAAMKHTSIGPACWEHVGSMKTHPIGRNVIPMVLVLTDSASLCL